MLQSLLLFRGVVRATHEGLDRGCQSVLRRDSACCLNHDDTKTRALKTPDTDANRLSFSNSPSSTQVSSSSHPTMTVAVDIFRVLASVSSTLMILSPIPSIYEMHKAKSTGVASIVPLVSMLFNCHVTMLYGYMDKNIFPVVTTFLTGDVCSLIYIAVFYWYTEDKAFAHKAMAGFGSATLLCTLYAILGGYGVTGQSRDNVTLTIGYLCVIATVVLYTSPFEKIGQVLKHRSGVFIPIHMVVAGVASNGMWLVYAGLVSEWIILAPNAFCFVMGIVQIVVYLVFHPRTHPLQLDSVHLVNLEAGHGDKYTKVAPATGSPCFVPIQSPPLVNTQQA